MRCLNCSRDGIDPATQVCPGCGVYLPSLMRDVLPPGTELNGGKYEIDYALGWGGFGITYAARHTTLLQNVAVKEFFPREHAVRNGTTGQVSVGTRERDTYERAMKRFVREGQVLAMISHPGVVRVRDHFEERSTAYLVMDLISPARTLHDEIDAHPGRRMPAEQVKRLMEQLVGALEAVHEKGIFHLDIKPDNILLTPGGQAILVDFGAARQGLGSRSTQAFTLEYAAPEVIAAGEDVGAESDLFELGMMLNEMLTGERPPTALSRLLNDTWKPTAIGAPWNALIASALRMKKEERPKSVALWWRQAETTTSSKKTETKREPGTKTARRTTASEPRAKTARTTKPPTIAEEAPAGSMVEGIVKGQYGDAVYGDETGYKKDSYYGRVAQGARLQLLDRRAFKNEFGLDIVKVKILSNQWPHVVGRIGWVGLDCTTFESVVTKGAAPPPAADAAEQQQSRPPLHVRSHRIGAEVRELLAAGRKIDAVNRYRSVMDSGTKEAQAFVDSVEKELKESAARQAKISTAPPAKTANPVAAGAASSAAGCLIVAFVIIGAIALWKFYSGGSPRAATRNPSSFNSPTPVTTGGNGSPFNSNSARNSNGIAVVRPTPGGKTVTLHAQFMDAVPQLAAAPTYSALAGATVSFQAGGASFTSRADSSGYATFYRVPCGETITLNVSYKQHTAEWPAEEVPCDEAEVDWNDLIIGQNWTAEK